MDQYLTVTALTKYIKAKLEGDKHLFSILLKGEISNFKRHSRGHFYFTLKDENAQISAIMFSRDTSRVLFEPKEGDHVLVQGKISLYEPSGSYSIQVFSMELDGIGELYQKYELLKKELDEKGYFDPAHKRSIPKFPKRIGVVTSPTGAVIEDIKNTVTRRYLLTEIYLYPALVQGPGSAQSIRDQIIKANLRKEVDVLIVGRGGGSIEDLWGFNEMPVIDAIYHSEIPIITAIGHETDYTLSDFVSDLRAPTPTAAAELATPNKEDLIQLIQGYQKQIYDRLHIYFDQKKTLITYMDQRLDQQSPVEKLKQLKKDLHQANEQLDRFMMRLIEQKTYRVEALFRSLKHPKDKIQAYKEQQTYLNSRLSHLYQALLDRKWYGFNVQKAQIEALNPLKLMDKGFAVIKQEGQLITSIHDVRLHDTIDIELKDGMINAEIKAIKEKNHG